MPAVSRRQVLAGWTLKAPGWWFRGDEVIFRRDTGVWFWYPRGFGNRAIGPFMDIRGAQRRALVRSRSTSATQANSDDL